MIDARQASAIIEAQVPLLAPELRRLLVVPLIRSSVRARRSTLMLDTEGAVRCLDYSVQFLL